MPFWLKESEKKMICEVGICVTHPGYTQTFLQGDLIFFFFLT